MRQVIAAATYLETEHLNGDLCRALETAIVVCYARPFDPRNKIGALGNDWVPNDASAELHEILLAARDKVYAHTDRTRARDVIDVGALIDIEHAYAEQWYSLDRGKLPGITKLAETHLARLRDEANKREEQLRGA
jgi:hypothetical protein